MASHLVVDGIPRIARKPCQKSLVVIAPQDFAIDHRDRIGGHYLLAPAWRLKNSVGGHQETARRTESQKPGDALAFVALIRF
jgi:hypothetical protein